MGPLRLALPAGSPKLSLEFALVDATGRDGNEPPGSPGVIVASNDRHSVRGVTHPSRVLARTTSPRANCYTRLFPVSSRTQQGVDVVPRGRPRVPVATPDVGPARIALSMRHAGQWRRRRYGPARTVGLFLPGRRRRRLQHPRSRSRWRYRPRQARRGRVWSRAKGWTWLIGNR